MILETKSSKIQSNSDSSPSQFRIATSAKAFQILSNSLYTNKIRAVIRELSCNAYDSHIQAEKGTEPFEVKLPTSLNTTFSVRDFGVGLTQDEVENLYTTYFESTKTESNDFVGALGLGSKSPFAYTDSFSITSIHEGKKTFYTAFTNEEGFPSILKMNEVSTDEVNGLEISFAVKKDDFNRFKEEAIYVFETFDVKPNINIEFPYPNKVIIEGNNWVAYQGRNGSFIVQGQVRYPLPRELEDSTIASTYITVPIGTLDITPSREELSMTKRTSLLVKKLIEDANKEILENIVKTIDTSKTIYEQYWELSDKTNSIRRSHGILDAFKKQHYKEDSDMYSRYSGPLSKAKFLIKNYNKNWTKNHNTIFGCKYTLIWKDKSVSLKRLNLNVHNILVVDNELDVKEIANLMQCEYIKLSDYLLPADKKDKKETKNDNCKKTTIYLDGKVTKEDIYTTRTKVASNLNLKDFSVKYIQLYLTITNQSSIVLYRFYKASWSAESTIDKTIVSTVKDFLNKDGMYSKYTKMESIFSYIDNLERIDYSSLNKDSLMYSILELKSSIDSWKMKVPILAGGGIKSDTYPIQVSTLFPIFNYISVYSIFNSQEAFKMMMPYFNSIKGDINDQLFSN